MCSLVWAVSFFLLLLLAKAADPDWSQRLLSIPVLIGGNAVRAGSSDEPRSRPRTDSIYLAPDPDLGPDPSPGSESRIRSLQIRVLCEPEEAKISIFYRFLSLNRTSVRQSSSWTVPFIVGIAGPENAMPG